MKPIIRVENLSKQYRIGAKQAPYATLRESLTSAVAAPFRQLRNFTSRMTPDPGLPTQDSDTIWALKDVSFEVQPGEVVGIIGHNGAGKSTLLKILSRITEPTGGVVDLYGRVSSLLEVGTGFHPELTGRENIYLNGAILGMKRGEIGQKFDEIVDFAEMDKFIDTPVKHYSSGMQMRLAFAVASNLEPEVLVVDEVLAVGDANFQKKCLGKMSDITKKGRTVIFVSHNMGAVQGLCDRAVWLKKGRIVADGCSSEVVANYLGSVEEGFIQTENYETGLQITKVVLRNDMGDATTNFSFGSSLRVDIYYQAGQKIDKPHFWIAIASQHGSLFGANMLLDGFRPEFIVGDGVISCVFDELSLLPQLYTISMGVRSEEGMGVLFRSSDVGFFHIVGTAHEIGLASEVADSFAWTSTSMIVPYEWHLPDGQVRSVDLMGRKGNRSGQGAD